MKPKDVYTRNKYENKGSSLRLEEAYIHTNRQTKKTYTQTNIQIFTYLHKHTKRQTLKARHGEFESYRPISRVVLVDHNHKFLMKPKSICLIGIVNFPAVLPIIFL